ncbi:MAG: D-2-hydroxyacid dehydrogenase [Caulobacteraceae bacterium]
MIRLLIFEPALRRIEAELAPLSSRLTPILVGADGELRLDGQVIDAEAARPDAAWASAELFESPAARAFMIAVLKAPRLRWLQSPAAGFDHPIFRQVVEKGARLTTSHGQAVGMAEYVMAGVLDHFQRGAERRAAQAERAWRRLAFREVMASHWLMFGFGAVGQAVAERARAFGAKVTGVRRDPAPHPLADEIASPDALAEPLALADVVVLCAPLSEATRGVANAAFFSAMKEGSVLVNVARGGLVDEAALLEALDAGRPEHAILDVFAEEPLPATSRLWGHPRLTLTAHASGITAGQDRRNQAVFLENLERFLDGAPLLNEAEPTDVIGASAVRP